MASALGVPLVRQPVYPYTEVPPLDEIMSRITTHELTDGIPILVSLHRGPSPRWDSDPRITTHELTELNYLFFQITCHSLWPISHLHIIPIERCVFLYTLSPMLL